MNIFSFNQVDLFPFSCVQDQVKLGEDSLVTHDSGSPVCPSVMGIVLIPGKKLHPKQSEGH